MDSAVAIPSLLHRRVGNSHGGYIFSTSSEPYLSLVGVGGIVGDVSHPQRFDDADPVLARLRAICLSLPGADEKVSHGRPAFFTKKIFAIYGAVLKGDHHSGQHDQALVFRPDPDEAPALAQDDRFFIPAYWGPYGWMAVDLNGDTDWDEVSELVEASFCETATKKLVAELRAH